MVVGRCGLLTRGARMSFFERLKSVFFKTSKDVKKTIKTPRNYLNEDYSSTGYALHGGDEYSIPLESWFAFPASARDDLDKNQYVLRKRSRDLYMSSSFFGSILHAKRDGVIGRGLSLDAKIDAEVLGLTDEDASFFEHKIEAAFNRFVKNVGVGGESFNEILQLAYFSTILSGDVIAVFYTNSETKSLKIDLIESDCLRTPPSKTGVENIKCGIELNQKGRAAAYWTATGFDYNSDGIPVNYIRIPVFMAGFNTIGGQWVPPVKKGALLIHTPFERPGQMRGLPICSRVITDIKQLDRYIKAELDASVAASKPALFRRHPAVESEAAVDMMDSFGEDVTAPKRENLPEKPINYGNGLMIDLYDGADMQAFNPLRPNTAYNNFVDHKFAEISANLGISSEVALKRWNASYSASRAALLDAQQGFEIERSRFVNQFVRIIYNTWLDLHADELGLFGYYTNPEFRSAWRASNWIGEQLPNIDPVKEIEAAAKRVSLGVSTLAREAQVATGSDIYSNIRQRGYEEKLLKEYGLVKDQNGVPID